MRPKKPLDPMLAFLLRHCLAGWLGGFVFGVLILGADFNGLWTLMSRSPDGILFGALFFFGLCVTFASVAISWGIFSLGQERDDPPEDRTRYY